MLILNPSPNEIKQATALVARYTLGGEQLYKKAVKTQRVPSNSVNEVLVLPSFTGEGCVVERLELYAQGKLISRNDYLVNASNKYQELNQLPQVTLRAKQKADRAGRKVIEVENPGKHTAVAVKFNVRRIDTDEAVLPAFFDEGYIHLLPGEKREVTVACDNFANTALSAEGYNVERQRILPLQSR